MKTVSESVNEVAKDTKQAINSTESKFNKMKEEFLKLMDNCKLGSELEILRIILLPEPYTLWQKCMAVRMELISVFARHYPIVKVEVFGSTVMGTAFKGESAV